jgi:hypothetical protein
LLVEFDTLFSTEVERKMSFDNRTGLGLDIGSGAHGMNISTGGKGDVYNSIGNGNLSSSNTNMRERLVLKYKM